MTRDKSNTQEFWIVSAFFMAALGVRSYHLGVPSLCYDEIKTALRIHHSFLDTILLLRSSEYPPLHYAVLNLWSSVFGNGEWALRFPSVIFSSLTVVVIYKLGKGLFSKNVGLLAALLLIFSPFAVNYAQNAKMYALLWFLEALSFLFFFRFLKDQQNRSHVLYVVTAVLCCYTLYTGFLFLLAQTIIFLFLKEKTTWKRWFEGQLIIIACCIPWLMYGVSSPHQVDLREAQVSLNYFTFFFHALAFTIGSSYDVWGRINYFLYAFLLTYHLIDVSSAAYKSRKIYLPATRSSYFLFLWIAITLLAYFSADLFIRGIHAQDYRYIGFMQIPLILLVSSQIHHFPSLVKRTLIVIMVLMAMYNTSIYFKHNLRVPRWDNWRQAAERLPQHLGDNEMVLSFLELPALKYYYKADTSRFFTVSAKAVVTQKINSIFVISKTGLPEKIKFDGFSMDHKTDTDGFCFLHFQRH